MVVPPKVKHSLHTEVDQKLTVPNIPADHLTRFDSWLNQTFPQSVVAKVVAYNFNISELSDGFLVEIIGSDIYDPNNSDWACQEVWTSRPNQFFFSIDEVGKEWDLFLDKLSILVNKFLEILPNYQYVMANICAITIGFVDGDLVVIRQNSHT
jgi:hypothetical protein